MAAAAGGDAAAVAHAVAAPIGPEIVDQNFMTAEEIIDEQQYWDSVVGLRNAKESVKWLEKELRNARNKERDARISWSPLKRVHKSIQKKVAKLNRDNAKVAV